jgi:hypothetical protein
MNLKLIFLPLAIAIEVPVGFLTGRATGFGNWVFDRELGDPNGKWWQTREEAIKEKHDATAE